jgi:hypothetical protein
MGRPGHRCDVRRRVAAADGRPVRRPEPQLISSGRYLDGRQLRLKKYGRNWLNRPRLKRFCGGTFGLRSFSPQAWKRNRCALSVHWRTPGFPGEHHWSSMRGRAVFGNHCWLSVLRTYRSEQRSSLQPEKEGNPAPMR